MKILYLLRHAQAESSFNLSDEKRELTDHGVKESCSLGEYIAKNKITIDMFKCSTAVRARQTYDGVIDGMSGVLPNYRPDIEYNDNLYNASIADIYKEIKNTQNFAKSLMIIAHNPSIHGIGHFLAQNGDSKIIEKHIISYPPATLTTIKCEIDDWSDLEAGVNEMVGCGKFI